MKSFAEGSNVKMLSDCRRPHRLSTQSVCVVLFDNFSSGSLSAIAEALRVANYMAGDAVYAMTLASPAGGPVLSSGVGSIQTKACDGILPSHVDLVVISEEEIIGPDRNEWDPAFASWLREMHAATVKICAVGTAVFKVARYGMLNEQRAAVPWFYADNFERQFPLVRARSTLIETKAQIMTCVGGIATLDFMLHYIAETNGLSLAADVADYMVYEGAREPSSTQRPARKSVPSSTDKVVAQILAIAESDVFIDAADIATQANISRRQLERICRRTLQCTPGRLVQILRLERSRVMLRGTEKSIKEIALESGFVSQSHFSKCYKSHFGHPPRRDRAGLFKLSPFAAAQHLLREIALADTRAERPSAQQRTAP